MEVAHAHEVEHGAFDLVVALDDASVDRDRHRVALQLPRREAPFQIVLLEEGLHYAREGFTLPFPEADFLAVGEEDVRHFELHGVGLCLCLGLCRIDCGLLGFDHGERPSVTVAEYVVGFGPVRKDVLEADGVGIEHVPALVLELGVNLDARKGFVGSRHYFLPDTELILKVGRFVAYRFRQHLEPRPHG